MQELLTAITFLTIVLAFSILGINRKEIAFSIPKTVIPLTAILTLVFWGALQFTNSDLSFTIIFAPFITGIIITLINQSLTNKSELFALIISFLPFVIIYKYFSDSLLASTGFLTVGILAGSTLRLLKTEKFLGNLICSTGIAIPLFAGLTWISILNLDEQLVESKSITILALAFIAILYGFALNFIQEDKQGLKRQAILIVTALVVYLIFNNILELTSNYLYLIIGSFVFAQILEVLSTKRNDNKDSLVRESLTGLGIILLVGFIVTRLFGIWGLIIVSICCTATSTRKSEKHLNWPFIASIFFSTKALVHIFISQTTLNVTGLNLNHPYVFVGLTVGLVIPFIITAFYLCYKEKFTGGSLLTILVFGLAIPLMSSYLIHCEASGALVIGLSISALLLTISGKAIGTLIDNKKLKIAANSLLPLAALTGMMLITTKEIVELGNIASRQARAEAFAAVTIIIVVLAIAQLNINKKIKKDSKPEE